MKLPTTPESVLPMVLEAMARTPDARLRALMTALARHLHAFVQETRLTEDEFQYAIEAIARLGQLTNDKHNEVVLALDILGVSSTVALLNNREPDGESDAALLGPFWRMNAPHCAPGESIARGDTPGIPLEVRGTVRTADGRPVAGATVDVWHASPVGMYENQDPDQPDMNLRGRFMTDDKGEFFLRSVKPKGYPVPTSGPCGDLLRAQLRQPYRPAHLHFMISKPGYRVLITQVFADDDELLPVDPVFGATRRLVGHFDVVAKDGRTQATLKHDFTLQPGELKFPRPPIA
jgi:catechol 1,2-dioxygenase